MRAGFVWLLSFLVYPLVSAPLLRARAFRAFGLPTRAVLSGGVGMVLVSWTMTVLAILRLRWGPVLVLTAGALAFALRLLLRRDESSPPLPAGEGRDEGAERAITLLAHALTLLSLLAALAATAAARSTSPDLLLFWGPKAQQFASARTIDAEFLGAPFLEYLHVYYPPLVTNVWAFGAMIAGRFPWGAATLTFPLLLAATSIGLFGILKTASGAAPAAVTTALATSAVGLIGIQAAVAGNAESSLLFFEVLAIAILMRPVSASTAGKLLAGLFLAGAATAKVEGLPFVFATAILFVLVSRERFRTAVRTLLLLIGPAVIALGAWFAFGELRHLFRGYRGYGKVFAIQWNNLGTIASATGAAFGKIGYALPWLVPLLVWLVIGPKSRLAILPIGTAILLAGFLVFTYLTNAGDPTQLIAWSAARVFTPVAALLALAANSSRVPDGGAAQRS